MFSSHHVTIDEIKVLNNTKFPNNLSSHYPVITKLRLQVLKKRGEWKKAKKISVFKNHNKVKWEEVDMILYKKLTDIKISHTEKYRGILTEDS